MNVSRRNFLGGLGATGALLALPGCQCPLCGTKPKAKIAVQLYSIREYIKNVGIEKALEDVAKIGYKGVEFAGYWGKTAEELRKMLDANGLVACGTHVGKGAFGLESIEKTAEFNLTMGNNLLISPGGGNFPPNPKAGEKPVDLDDWMKALCEYYNKSAEAAAKLGCKVGLHNHTREFTLKLKDGTTYWDYFFGNTTSNVCMEQDVGWTTCAGHDPKVQYKKYPHRSPTLHAKENGMGAGVTSFDAILGQPGKPGAVGVDWDGLIPVTEEDGVQWYVVECERHANDLSAITPSYEFLKSKGLN